MVSRYLSEAFLARESGVIPAVSWLTEMLSALHIRESQALKSLFVALVVAAAFLVLGLFSRASAISAWFLHLTTVKSSALFCYGADYILTAGLFYLMFVPFPDRYSLDHFLWPAYKQRVELLGFFRRVLQIHLCFIYFFGGLTKAIGPGWWNGDSLWRALTRPPFDLLPRELLLRGAVLFAPGAIATWFLELSYPILIWPKKTRQVWLVMVCLMHIAIGLAMGMYLFAFLMLVLNIAGFAPAFRRGAIARSA